MLIAFNEHELFHYLIRKNGLHHRTIMRQKVAGKMKRFFLDLFI